MASEHEKANSSNLELLIVSTNEFYCSRLLDEAFLIAYIVLGVAIFVGNTFCCTVFLATPKLRRCYMNIFLVSHGFADIFVATLVVPGHCTFCTNCSKDFILQRIVDEGTCRFLDAVKDYVWLASVLSLLGITYDRYLAVCQPLLYQCKMTPRTVVVCLLIIWLLPIPFSFIKPILNAAYVDFLRDGSLSESIFDMVVVSTLIILPLAILFIVNIMITKAIRNQHRKVQCERSNNQGNLKRKEGSRKTIACLVVVLVFLVCWFPRCLLNFFFLFKMLHAKGLLLLEKISLVFLFIQSSVNPFLYSFYRRDFRQAAGSLLRQCFPYSFLRLIEVKPRLNKEASTAKIVREFSNCETRSHAAGMKLQEIWGLHRTGAFKFKICKPQQKYWHFEKSQTNRHENAVYSCMYKCF